MNGLEDESELFSKLKKRLNMEGDTKENFIECVKIAMKYDAKERQYILYKIDKMLYSDTGLDVATGIIKIAQFLSNKNLKYGFYKAVIEASFE